MERVILFCNNQGDVPAASDDFQRAGVLAECIHGDIRRPSGKNMQAFPRRQLTALVATDVASRGIDVDDGLRDKL